ncbi:MAG: hypothetical protein JW809_11710 [Pirellulales bacterium]|nr:hypothetical protein [Pirellulales bacterium]
MNLVGKILTVLIFVMSIVFASMAVMVYATHRNWYDVVTRTPEKTPPGQKPGLKFQLQQETDRRKHLELELARLEKQLVEERQARDTQVAQLESTVGQLQQERDQREKDIQDFSKRLNEALATLEVEQKNLSNLDEERLRLVKLVEDTQKARDAAFKDSVAAADLLHQAETEQRRLETRLTELTVDATRYRDLLRLNQINPDADPASVLPDVDGRVLAVVGGGLVEVSIGADDGLKARHRLEVFRNAAGKSSYLGRIEVVQTAPDRAVCKILPEYRKGEIHEGDSIASRLN